MEVTAAVFTQEFKAIMKDLPTLFKILIFPVLLIVSCTSKEDIHGQYVGSYKSNIDSIQLLPDGSYRRAIYDNNKKKIFSNRAKYEIKDGYVMFDDFLLNENDLSTDSRYNSDDLLLACLPYEWTLSGNVIVSNHDLEYYYVKQ